MDEQSSKSNFSTDTLVQATFAALNDYQFLQLASAGFELQRLISALEKSDRTIVRDMFSGVDSLQTHQHYPDDDVIDHDTHAQYYYHYHRNDAQEHGHFHTYLFASALPEKLAEHVRKNMPEESEQRDGFVHLVAFSMDDQGLPCAVFTVNQWVGEDAFLPAEDLISLLPLYRVTHAEPSYAANRALSLMIQVFKPQIIDALFQRDACLSHHAQENNLSQEEAFADRDLEITSNIPITLKSQMALIEAEMTRRGLTAN